MQEQIINTLEKGLITDVEPQYQPQGSYRLAKNMKLMNNGGNNYSLTSDTGMKLSVSIPQSTGSSVFWEVIGWDTYEDLDAVSDSFYVVVFMRATNSLLSGWGQIGLFNIDLITGIGTFESLYAHEELNFDNIYTMNGVMIKTIYETENKIRVYWTDNKNEPRVLNISLIETVTSGSLVNGNSYMVLNEVVTYNTVQYGIGAVAGNIFTANATTTYTGSGKVINYIPIEQLKWMPDYTPCKILNLPHTPNTGNILCGKYGIAVRLRYKNEYSSPWTPIHSLQSVYQESVTTSSYQEIQGDQGSSFTAKTLRWQIDAYDDNYDTLEVALVRASGKDVFDSPELIYSGTYNIGSNIISYSGVEMEKTLTPEELVELLVVFKKVGTIETSKNRMFAGNVEFSEDITESTFGSVFVNRITDELPHDTFAYPTDPDIFGHTLIPATISSGDIITGGKYLVEGTFGVDQVEYPASSGIAYRPGQIIIGTYGNSTYGASGSPTLKPVYVKRNYLGKAVSSGNLVVGVRYYVNGGVILQGFEGYRNQESFLSQDTTFSVSSGSPVVYEIDLEIIHLQNDFWDHKGIVNGSYKKHFSNYENKRLGLLLYDKKGNPLEVIHLYDYEFKAFAFNEIISRSYTSKTNAEYRIRTQGLVIGGSDTGPSGSALNLTKYINPTGSLDIKDSLISGFSIVVADIETETIAKGMCLDIVTRSGKKHPEAHLRADYDSGVSDVTNKYLIFISPDLLLDSSISFQDLDIVLEGQRSYTVETNIISSDPKGILEVSGGTRNEGYYHKMVVGSNTLAEDVANIDQITRVTQAETAVQIDSQDNTIVFDNTVQTGTGFDAVNTYTGFGGTVDVIRFSDSPTNTMSPSGGSSDYKKLYAAIKKKGGTAYPSLRNTFYKFAGHYQPVTQDVINKTDGIFRSIQFFGGDNYLGFFDYSKGVMDESTSTNDHLAFSLIFPCESKYNFNLRRGRHFARDGFKLGSDNPNGISLVSPENLIFDDNYKSNHYLAGYPGKDIDNEIITKAKTSVYYSDSKTIGEAIDKWRKFRSNNYNDLDSNGGPIIALKVKQNYLFAFQRKMVTYLPVNQQAAITEAFNQVFTVGVGGVIDRYDNIDSFLGLEDKGSIIEVPDGLVYFNRENQAIIYMQIGGKGAEVSSIKQIKEIIDDTLFAKALSKGTTDANSDNMIVAGYDKANKEIYITFKSSDIDGFSIGLNDQLKAFNSIYDFRPQLFLGYRNLLLSYLDLANFTTIQNSTAYVVGDELKDTFDQSVYVCILGYTSGNPATAVGSDSTHWKKFYTVGEIYIHNFDKEKAAYYYGRSYNEEVQFVVNSNNNQQKIFDSYQINGSAYNGEDLPANLIVNGTGMIDDIESETTYQKRNETPLDLKWRNNNFIGTYQTDRNDSVSKRLRDKYLKVKLTKKNFNANDPTTNVGVIRKIVSLISKLRSSF
jgi:hypothetical protein